MNTQEVARGHKFSDHLKAFSKAYMQAGIIGLFLIPVLFILAIFNWAFDSVVSPILTNIRTDLGFLLPALLSLALIGTAVYYILRWAHKKGGVVGLATAVILIALLIFSGAQSL